MNTPSGSGRVLNLMTMVATVCAVVATGILLYRQLQPDSVVASTSTPAMHQNRAVAAPARDIAAGRRMGPEDALLTIIYFGDFECPACRAFAQTVATARRRHPSSISVVFRHWPLPYHRFAYPSARAAECAADQGQFEAMYDALYASQDSLGFITFTELARRADVSDLKKFEACMRETRLVERIERDRKDAEAAKIPGTPGIIIGDTLYAGTIPTYDDLEKLLVAQRQRSVR